MRFYHIDLEVDVVDPPRFFNLANRLAAYEGVISARIQAEQEQSKKKNPSRAVREDPNVKMVDEVELLNNL